MEQNIDLKKIDTDKLFSKKLEINTITRKSDIIFNVLFIMYCLLCIGPLILIFMVSITDQNSLIENGYSFFPNEINFKSYEYLWSKLDIILKAYSVTIIVSVVGTILSVLLVLLYSYPISRKTFKYRNFFSFLMFFTMLFNGGLVPWFILYTQYLKINDTLVALIAPHLVMAFNVLIVKTYLSMNLPDSVLESARIDGAGEIRIFMKIVIPLSIPVIATIGLFQTLLYWNDWYICMLYIDSPDLYNVQYTMYKVLRSIEFLTANATNVSGSSIELLKIPGETLRMAMAIIGIGPIVFAYPFFQKYFIKGLTLGAVKG